MVTSINLLGGGGGGDTAFRDAAVSPEGKRSADPLPADIAARNEELVDAWADRLYHETADNILDWTREYAPGPVVLTMSMENTVLVDLAQGRLPGVDMVFLDTEYHFAETLTVAEEVEARYPGNKLIRAKAILSRQEQDETYGKNMYQWNPTACCRMRKVEPIQRELSAYVGAVDGLRRADGPTRADAPALSLNKTGRLKISPIITWSLADTEDYIREQGLISHPLTYQGYPSIGCATCTLPVAPGEDPRAGRWAGSGKTECGLHTD